MQYTLDNRGEEIEDTARPRLAPTCSVTIFTMQNDEPFHKEIECCCGIDIAVSSQYLRVTPGIS